MTVAKVAVGIVLCGVLAACTKAATAPVNNNSPAGNTPLFRVTVGQIAGTRGTGIVTGPNGINCLISSNGASGSCSAEFAQGDQVTLTASPNAGFSFGGWAGSCAGAGTNPVCTLGINGTGNYDPQARFN